MLYPDHRNVSVGKTHGVCDVSICLEVLVPPSTSPQFPRRWFLPSRLADLGFFVLFKPGTDAFDVCSLLSARLLQYQPCAFHYRVNKLELCLTRMPHTLC